MRLNITTLFTLLSFYFSQAIYGQYISISPSNPSLDEEVTLTFDASQGNKELVGATKVYMHHGIVVDKADGVAWTRVKGNWGKDDGIGLMTKVAGTDKWTIKMGPSLRSYFGSPASETIYRISCVFRSADGTKKGTAAPGTYAWGSVIANQDAYVNISKEASVVIEGTASSEVYLTPGQKLNIRGIASSTASEMKVFIDEGFGYFEQKSQSNTKEIAYDFSPSKSQFLRAKIEATIGSTVVKAEREYNIVIKSSPSVAALPQGLKPGINYNGQDPTKVTLVLEAPKKEFVYVVGDFNNWLSKEEYLMKVTPDKQTFWIELTGLTPLKKYGFQYWIDGKVKIGDPYSELIADPWNDKFIENTVYPDPYIYDKTENGLATILQTGRPTYTWSSTENTWKKPKADNLVIYELHLRDFLGNHSYKSLIDTLSYIKKLGVNAIEFMPLGEFEGNDSWGYNPSYHMALDKYYGTKDDLKKLVEACHSNGLAVILDIVFNHAYGQNPLLMMYFDGSLPEANNPYFNRTYVGPFQWGYDFNHESAFTQRYMDQINEYWLKEYHIDGFRFDFTKGFTNSAPNNSLDAYDASRIAILKRMIGKIKEATADPIIILEHFGQPAEETELATTGAKMWANRSYDYVPAANGNPSGSFNGVNSLNHISYFNSHDEQRIQYHMKNEGLSSSAYQIKQDPIWYERLKLTAAFHYLLPGPKMVWQFDELGYDINIDENGRVGRKPHPWAGGSLNYYSDPMRQNIYKAYQAIINLRNTYTMDKMIASSTAHILSGDVRRITYDNSEDDLVVIGNFSTTTKTHSPQFTQPGKWYNYINGSEINVTDVNQNIELAPGELRIYSTKKLSSGFPNVFNTFANPVTITPATFKKNDLITLRFDATKASSNGTKGLIGAAKVYFHSGAVTGNDFNWTTTKGNLTDDGVGLMTKVATDIWEIKFTPEQYYNLAVGTDLFKIGMYFRDGNNANQGKGFMNTDIYFDVASGDNIVTIDPPQFKADSEITITFNAGEGNKELLGVDKIYMHSSVDIVKSDNPVNTAWNKVIGNWGKDDGIGLMTRTPNTNLYTMKLKPSTYYKLGAGEFPYWLAAVFRNADGSKKGTARAGNLSNGFVAPNLDFFIRNSAVTSVEEYQLKDVEIYPNPTSGRIAIKGLETSYTLKLYNLSGSEIYSTSSENQYEVMLPTYLEGLYYYSLQSGNKYKQDMILIVK
jgi:glycosidase